MNQEGRFFTLTKEKEMLLKTSEIVWSSSDGRELLREKGDKLYSVIPATVDLQGLQDLCDACRAALHEAADEGRAE
jgi:hypothetical protein